MHAVLQRISAYLQRIFGGIWNYLWAYSWVNSKNIPPKFLFFVLRRESANWRRNTPAISVSANKMPTCMAANFWLQFSPLTYHSGWYYSSLMPTYWMAPCHKLFIRHTAWQKFWLDLLILLARSTESVIEIVKGKSTANTRPWFMKVSKYATIFLYKHNFDRINYLPISNVYWIWFKQRKLNWLYMITRLSQFLFMMLQLNPWKFTVVFLYFSSIYH